jgi:hypothetical protein
MTTTIDGQRPGRQYSATSLWIGLISALLFLVILLESACLGILYVNDTLDGKDVSAFARGHLLTRLFASTPINPVPGKKFLGNLREDGWQWTQWSIADGLLGWRLAAGVSVFYDLFPPNKYLYVTDDHGFSIDVDDPPITLRKPADAYRVVVLGGSTVMGEGAPRPSQNIVSMLRRGIQARGLSGPDGRRVELINAGVDSYNSSQEYLYLVSDLLRFTPDLVVAYDGWNDSVYDFEKNLSPFRTSIHEGTERHIENSYSITGSVFLVLQNLKNLFTSSQSKIGMIELPWRVVEKLRPKADSSYSSTPFDARSLEFYNVNRRAFLALGDDQLSVALFLQPIAGVDDRTMSNEEKASWWYPSLDEQLKSRIPFYKGARHILADLKSRDQGNRHSCIADLSRSLEGVADPVYADTGHLLPKGNEVVASHILDELVSCGLLSQSARRF